MFFDATTQACEACSVACQPGQYIASACSATSDLICGYCTKASNCGTCLPEAPDHCLTCIDFETPSYVSFSYFIASDFACTSCTECAPNQYRISQCSGDLDTQCGACDPSCATCNGPPPGNCATTQSANALEMSSETALHTVVPSVLVPVGLAIVAAAWCLCFRSSARPQSKYANEKRKAGKNGSLIKLRNPSDGSSHGRREEGMASPVSVVVTAVEPVAPRA